MNYCFCQEVNTGGIHSLPAEIARDKHTRRVAPTAEAKADPISITKSKADSIRDTRSWPLNFQKLAITVQLVQAFSKGILRYAHGFCLGQGAD